MKIDLSTPYKDVLTTLQREHDKAIYWYNKEIKRLWGSEQKLHDNLNQTVMDDPEHNPAVGDIITWTSPDGNKWVMCTIFCYMQNAQKTGWRDYSFCYYETEGSVGIFDYDDDGYVSVYTSHFFQRFEERMNIDIPKEDHAINLLAIFLSRNPTMLLHDAEEKVVAYEKDGLRHFYGITYEGLVLGVLHDDDHYFEGRSFVPTSMLFKEQREKAKGLFEALEEYKKFNEDKAEESVVKDEDMPEWYHPVYDEWHQRVQDFFYAEKYDRLPDIKGDAHFLPSVLFMARIMRASTKDRIAKDPDTKTIFKACVDVIHKIQHPDAAFKYMVKKDGTGAKDLDEISVSVLMPMKEHFDVTIPLDIIREKMREINDFVHRTDNKNKNEESMNSTIVTAFKQCMKKNGAKNFDTLVKEFCKGDVNSYLSLAEVEYVVSRIAAAAQSDRDREKYREANKAWLSLVIDNDWSQLLRPYTGRYGKELVKMSICDMIDHDEWWSPALNTDLKNHGDEFLRMQQKGLEAIDDDINEKIFNDESLEALLPGHSSNENENENENKIKAEKADGVSCDMSHDGTEEAEEAVMPDLIDFADTPKRSGLLCSPDVARRSLDNMHKCIDMFARMYQNVSAFVDENGKDDVAQKTCERQQREIGRLQKKIDELKEKNDKLETQRGEAQALANSRHEEITKLKKDKEQLEKDKENIIKRYNDLDKQHTELKEKAQDGTPRKKMITLSRLTKFANMGSADKPSKSCMLLIDQVFPLVDVVVDMKH